MTGTQLREALASLNKTQEEFANDLGVSFSTVNRWIRGKTNPNRLTLRAIRDQLEKYATEQNPPDDNTSKEAI